MTRRRVETGRLFRLHRGVVATHPPPYSREQRWLAAVLACGPGALLSDHPAAAHMGIANSVPSLHPHVTVPHAAGRTRSGIVVHRRGPIDPRDIRRWNGIPVTSPELILIHLAPTLESPELERILVAAESKRLLSRPRLSELLTERAGRPGTSKLLPLLTQEPAIVRSDFELLMLPILRIRDIPRPVFNHPVPGTPFTVDLAWPDLRLVVELDSQRWHGDWERAEADRERDQLLALAHHLCHRFVRSRLIADPNGSAHRLEQLVNLRAADVA